VRGKIRRGHVAASAQQRRDEAGELRAVAVPAVDQGAEHGHRGRDERIAIEERRAEDSEQHQSLSRLAVVRELVFDQRDE